MMFIAMAWIAGHAGNDILLLSGSDAGFFLRCNREHAKLWFSGKLHTFVQSTLYVY